MKTLLVPTQSKTVSELLKKARTANVLLRSETGEQFVLVKVPSVQAFYVGGSDDFDEEVQQTRANKKLMRFLDKRGEQAQTEKLIPLAEVEKKLGLTQSRARSTRATNRRSPRPKR